MKKLVPLLLAVFMLGFNNYSNAQTQSKSGNKLTQDNFYFDADNLAYYLEGARLGIIPFNPAIPVKPAEFKSTKIESSRVISDSPDVAITTATNTTQSENSVFVDPNNNQHVLNSNNSTDWDGSTVDSFYGADYFRTYNFGSYWSGSITGAGGDNGGDPAAAITNTGRRYIGYINDDRGQEIAYSTNGTIWTNVAITGTYYYPDLMDKNHLMVDNTPGGFYEGNVYSAWTHLEYSPVHPNHKEIEFVRSTDNGLSWSSEINISDGANALYMSQGANIQIGPTGQVYVCFTIYDNAAVKAPNDETAIGFTRSLDGGVSFNTAIRAIDNIKGLRHTGIIKNMRVNSFPSMAVDVSGGAFNGDIYIVWANRGTPGINTGTNVSVYMIKSTNSGTSWSSPVKVNQGTYANGKEAYIPWITCDPTTGNLFCIFYDDRNTTSTDVETWVAYSIDGGTTWEDFRVSDVSFTPTPISGTAGDYFGDYLGITARDNYVYPCWTDNRSGVALTYVSPFYFSDYCYASATNTNYEYISNVNIGNIDNNTGSDGYADYTALSTDISLNGSELLTVTNGDPSSVNQCGVWIDYNQDNDFEDAGETISLSGTPGIGPYTATISPPAGTTTGECLMRIRITYNSSPEPCGTLTYGEVEDYTINLTPMDPNVWTGNLNDYWGNHQNWSLGHIPTADEDVIIPNINMPCIVDYSDKTCHDITIESGATVQIYDQALDVTDDATVYGSFELLHTAARLNIDDNIIWKPGSTGSMTGSATIDVVGNWTFESGANVQFSSGYINFSGSGDSYIRCYEDNCSIYHLRNYKNGAGDVLGVSGMSTKDFHITGNIYNYSSSTFYIYSAYSVVLDGFFNNMGGNFYFDYGTFVFNGNPVAVNLKPNVGNYFNNLTVNVSTYLALDNTYTNELLINGDVVISDGTLQANAFDISVAGNWTNSGTGTFDPGTSSVIFEYPDFEQDVNGNCTFYDVQQVNTTKFLRFNNTSGSTTILHDLDLDYYCYAYRDINVNGELNINNTASRFIAVNSLCNTTVGSLNQGGTLVCNGGVITVNDLFEPGIYGTHHVISGTINLHQDGSSYIDLNGDLIIDDGQINIYGSYGGISVWPYTSDASITMSGGVLDFKEIGISLGTSYIFTVNITGGTIRTIGGFYGNRADFNPAGGTLEFYGSGDYNISQVPGCTLYDVSIDKSAKDSSSSTENGKQVIDERTGAIISNGGKGNSISLNSDIIVTNDLDITSGTMTIGSHNLTIDGDCNINAIMDVGATGNVLNHGLLNLGSTGTLTITGGSFINDHPYGSEAWQYMQGTFNLSAGLFEIMHNSILLESTFVDNISGGTIRTGHSFRADNAGTFEPSGGTFEFTGTGGSPFIDCAAGNFFNDLDINSSVNYNLYTDAEVRGDMTIDNGLLSLNHFDLSCLGNVNITNGGAMSIGENSALKLDDGSALTVATGGEIQIVGSAGNEATVSHISSGTYNFSVFGTIAAEYAVFEYMNGSSINVKSSGTVDVSHSFNNCIFRNGAPAPSALLTINNDQTLACNNVYFENTSGSTGYNVWKYYDTGDVTFVSASGDFAGPVFEYDPNNRIDWTDMDINVDITVMLEGPYNGTDMNTDLNNLGLIPLSQPFDAITYADWYYTGSESVGSIPPNVVDWVLVQIRDADNATSAGDGTVVAEQAAFLLNDGSIVDLDGSSNLDFTGITYSSGLFPVVWHRNHLGVISANKVTRTGGVYTYDFTQLGSAYSSSNAGETNLGGGVYGMWGGDGNGTGWVYNDGEDIWWWEDHAGESNDYFETDYNLDGQVENTDKNDVWFGSWNMVSQIPSSKKSGTIDK